MFQSPEQREIAMQLVVIGAISGGEKSQCELRAIVNCEFPRLTLAGFYSLMARMEDRGLVLVRKSERMDDDIHITTRFYRYSGGGRLVDDRAVSRDLDLGGLAFNRAALVA